MEIRTTHDSLLRAFGLLVGRASQARQIQQKFAYKPFGTAVHATRVLTKDEAKKVNDLVGKLKALDPQDDANNSAIESMLKQLSALPVRFVPMKYEHRIARSKAYPYGSQRQGY